MEKDYLNNTHFSAYVKPSQIIFNLKAQDKIAAFEELLDLLKDQQLIKDRKPILTRIVDRERLESTGVGHGVALPHARIDTGHDIAVVVGRSVEGIDFDAVDGEKVRLIILVVWNPSIPGLFNHLFAGLAKFLIRPDFRDRLFNASSASGLFDVLAEIELMLPQQPDMIINRASLLWKLQEIEIQKKKARGKALSALKQQSELIRSELDETLLDRFDRLMERYGFSVAKFQSGTCMGCYINVATGMGSLIEGSNDIYVCENCGKFLVSVENEENQSD